MVAEVINQAENSEVSCNCPQNQAARNSRSSTLLRPASEGDEVGRRCCGVATRGRNGSPPDHYARPERPCCRWIWSNTRTKAINCGEAILIDMACGDNSNISRLVSHLAMDAGRVLPLRIARPGLWMDWFPPCLNSEARLFLRLCPRFAVLMRKVSSLPRLKRISEQSSRQNAP